MSQEGKVSRGPAVESFEEFLCLKHHDKDAKGVDLSGWVFQAVDLQEDTKENFASYNVSGAVFLGCTFPEGVRKNELISRYFQFFSGV